jgi:hypothetical protein
MSNLDLRYRPLLIGTSIINTRVNEPGTIGFFAKDGATTWLVSCYHVLCDNGLRPYVQDDPIYQPAAPGPANQVALTAASKSNADLDCAAALVQDDIVVQSSALGLGAIKGVITPQIGMRVVKAGSVGGLTEGIITQISGTSVIVRTDPEFPQDYVLSQPGDSGSLWIDQETRAAVALHRGVRNPRTATAISVGAVLLALTLSLA